MRFEITGERGLPCGNWLSWQAICASTVATFSFNEQCRLEWRARIGREAYDINVGGFCRGRLNFGYFYEAFP